MGSNQPTSPAYSHVLLLVAASVVLLVIGLILHRRGVLRSRPAALAWAILTVLPLFGGGVLFFFHHVQEQQQGITHSGENTPAQG